MLNGGAAEMAGQNGNGLRVLQKKRGIDSASGNDPPTHPHRHVPRSPGRASTWVAPYISAVAPAHDDCATPESFRLHPSIRCPAATTDRFPDVLTINGSGSCGLTSLRSPAHGNRSARGECAPALPASRKRRLLACPRDQPSAAGAPWPRFARCCVPLPTRAADGIA
jgi:hypothetical protein